MSLTPRQLNRATLERQMLLRREPLGVVAGLRRVVALQAQQEASPYLALWSRLADFQPADLDRAFTGHEVVKSTLIRLTLHTVHAEDYPDFHRAVLSRLRDSRFYDRRFTSTGLSADEAEALAPLLLEFLAEPHSNAEIEERIEKHFGERKPGLWWALRTSAAVHRAPTGGPWSFDRAAFTTTRTRPSSLTPHEATQKLVLRYLEAFGPASAADVAQFTFLRGPDVGAALRALDGQLSEIAGPGRVKLFDRAGAEVPDPETPAPPRFLPMWDSILLAYADRSRVLPASYRPVIIRRNGDVLPTLLVDGYVAGVWRPVEGGIEATSFQILDEETWAGLGAEAAALVAFLAGRGDPEVYRRYGHWWTKGLPAAEVRVLPG